ncbi:MAG: hypothetical protein K0R13_2622 [Propionibacteriaceae bacterium]|jgi:hypothetical protein|nr:hypothetical protein [Propionibacteriaceae bacterium]
MARCPIVRPETVRVTLADGEWLELAKELTAGEHREMFVAQVKDAPMGLTSADGLTMDLRQVGISKVLAYVKDWSFVDFKGEPLPVTVEWLRKFDQNTFQEVLEAVVAHDEACEKAIEARKNVPATVS